MAEGFALRLWTGRAVFLLLAAVLVHFRLLPLGTMPDRFPEPDLLLCLTFAWLLRRPEQVPPLLIAGLFLLCDFLFLRPPGLWTIVVLLSTEFLRSRTAFARELPFALEWAMVSGVLIAATFAEHLALALFMVPKAGLGIALGHSLVTILAYPAVVAVLRLMLGLRRAVPGELDGLGGRL